MKLIGHRGVGAEKYAQATPTSTRRTHIQENTVLSFVTASKSGADFIEFDVQVRLGVWCLGFRGVGSMCRCCVGGSSFDVARGF